MYPKEFHDSVVTWLLVVQTQKQIKKRVNKDIRLLMVEYMARAWKNDFTLQFEKEFENQLYSGMAKYAIENEIQDEFEVWKQQRKRKRDSEIDYLTSQVEGIKRALMKMYRKR